MTDIHDSLESLHQLFDYDVKKFISAEAELLSHLPKFMEASSSLKLKNILMRYEEYVKNHLSDLNNFIQEEKISLVDFTNAIMIAFIKDVNDKMALCANSYVKDACILSCIQGINHYKISVYGSAAAFSNALGMPYYAKVFHEAEVNEKKIDDRLSQLAEFEINNQAKVRLAYS